MYVNLVFLAAFIGYSVGTAPVIGYHYGAGNHRELKGLLKRSLVIIGICSAAMVVAGEALAWPLSQVFVGYDQGLLHMTFARVCDLFLLLPFFAGISIFWFFVFHCVEQRIGFCGDFIPADPGVSGGGGADSAPLLEAGWNLRFHGGGGAIGIGDYGAVPGGKEKAVSLCGPLKPREPCCKILHVAAGPHVYFVECTQNSSTL